MYNKGVVTNCHADMYHNMLLLIIPDGQYSMTKAEMQRKLSTLAKKESQELIASQREYGFNEQIDCAKETGEELYTSLYNMQESLNVWEEAFTALCNACGVDADSYLMHFYSVFYEEMVCNI